MPELRSRNCLPRPCRQPVPQPSQQSRPGRASAIIPSRTNPRLLPWAHYPVYSPSAKYIIVTFAENDGLLHLGMTGAFKIDDDNGLRKNTPTSSGAWQTAQLAFSDHAALAPSSSVAGLGTAVPPQFANTLLNRSPRTSPCRTLCRHPQSHYANQKFHHVRERRWRWQYLCQRSVIPGSPVAAEAGRHSLNRLSQLDDSHQNGAD